MIGYIYKITSPTGKVYIGQTCNFRNRFSQYKRLACNDQPAIYNSFIKHGFEKHCFEIIYKGPYELLDYMEDLFIRTNNSVRNGLNCRSGGKEGNKWSEESRKKLSESKKGLPDLRSPEAKERTRQAILGNRFRRGKKWSDESKRKFSESQKGRIGRNRKKVNCYNLDNSLFKTFDSCVDALRFFDKNPSSGAISNAIKCGGKCCNKYWKYVSENC